MNIVFLKKEKNEVELTIDNITIAEILRVYLNEAGADLAVWRREHPSKPVVMKIVSSDKPVTRVVSEAVSALKKDLSKLSGILKK